MEIPPNLVLSSAMLDPALQQQAKKSLSKEDIPKDYKEFCLSTFSLFLLILDDHEKGKASLWYPWIQSLPKTFTTWIYWDDQERVYAQKLGLLGTLKVEEALFSPMKKVLADVKPPGHRYDPKTLKWAFTFVYHGPGGPNTGLLILSRLQICSTTTVDQRGYSADDPVIMVQRRSSLDDDSLFFDYGEPHNPARLAVAYGVCDTSSPAPPFMPVIQCFASRLGFLDDEAMVIYTDIGGVSNRVWLERGSLSTASSLRARDAGQQI